MQASRRKTPRHLPVIPCKESSQGHHLPLILALLAIAATCWPESAGATKKCDVEALCIMEEENVSIAIGLGREQRITDAPSNVYVITDEDIKQSGAIDLPTILRRVPGMEVMQVT